MCRSGTTQSGGLMTDMGEIPVDWRDGLVALGLIAGGFGFFLAVYFLGLVE